MDIFLILSFITFIIVALMMGFPVGFTIGGVSILYALILSIFDLFDFSILFFIPERLFGIISNTTLMAIPLFCFMGSVLEKSGLAKELLETVGIIFGKVRGGIAITVIVVGALLAASTGIVGASVVTMGLIALPVMIKSNYDHKIATGVINASGTLGQIIPPSIILIILGDVISSSYQQSQLAIGNFSPDSVSVGDLFVGAVFPGLLLVSLYILYVIVVGILFPKKMPCSSIKEPINLKLILKLLKVLVPTLGLIIGVLGSILLGLVTPNESAIVGCIGAMLIAFFRKKLSFENINTIVKQASSTSAMVFLILIGANIFSLVFRGLGGDELIENALILIPGGKWAIFFVIMLLIFIMGFFLDFFEITVIVIPIVSIILFKLGIDPVWFAIMVAMNLQTSFLTPPFGFALFYLRGVAPKEVSTSSIYAGAIPFIIIQIVAMGIIFKFPEIATFLPKLVYG